MNKIIKFLAIPALVAGLSSCKDWLDLPSESKMDSQSVFNTIGRAEMTVMGAYNWLHTQELGYQLLMGTDECSSTESNSKYNVSNYDYTATSSILSNTYTSMYKAIEYSNVCIDGLPKMTVSDGDTKKRDMLLGEALAIRAYAYWNLVRFYGDVPFTTVPTSQLETFSSGRTSRDVIWDQCVADLQQAVTLLPWKSEGMVATPERFTKNSAYGILARVALYAAGYSLRWDLNTVPYSASTVRIAQRDDQSRIRELYQIAADACKAVISKGENKLLGSYEQLFRDLALEQYNEETMLEFGWHGPQGPDVRTGYTNGIPTSGTSSVIGKGGSQMMAMPTFYFEYEEGDQRRDVSICNYGISGGSKDYYRMETYAGMGVGKYRINWKKERGSTDSRRDINWPLLRYSDVLLMYAEALNELNGGAGGEAVDAVRQVRLRAFNGDAAKVGNIPTGQQDFRNFIIQERKLELSNEGLRKSDLCRWGILYETLTAEKAKLVQLCNHEGKYADIPQYRVYKLDQTPQLQDPHVALPYQDATEADIQKLGITGDELVNLHTLNSGDKGLLKKKLLEGSDGKVYFAAADVPAGVTTSEVEYNILNMWSINSMKQKGNLSVKEVKEDGKTIAANNAWITGATGIFYGLKKNMTEIMPFHTTAIIDVNPGLAGQQHPCY